jgi:hypothetical protein
MNDRRGRHVRAGKQLDTARFHAQVCQQGIGLAPCTNRVAHLLHRLVSVICHTRTTWAIEGVLQGGPAKPKGTFSDVNNPHAMQMHMAEATHSPRS